MIQTDRFFKTAAAGLLVLLLAGCRPATPPPATVPLPAVVSCGAGIAGEEQLAAPLVLLGEIHGTREIPAAFEHLVCRAAAERRGATILVGLEIFSQAQSALDTFLAGDGAAAAGQAFLAQELWQRAYQDGRSSEAMFRLLDDLRRLRKAGLKIEVLALDPDHYDSWKDRDVRMTAALSAAIAALHPTRTLVLIGDVHARTQNGYPWDAKADYVPFGALLKTRYGDLIALNVASRGGSAWTCMSADAKDCGPHPVRARDTAADQNDQIPRITLDPAAAAKSGYSGALHLGPLTESAPKAALPFSQQASHWL
jgi:hypothetical protein